MMMVSEPPSATRGRDRRPDARPRVLIGDDNVGFRDTLAEVIDAEGMDVVLAEDGEQVVGLARDAGADVLLLDVRMPALSGLDAYRLLVQLGLMAPAIFLTTGPTRDLLERARTLGAVAMLDKLNVELDRLIRLIRATLHAPPEQMLKDVLDLLLDPAAFRQRQPAPPDRRRVPIVDTSDPDYFARTGQHPRDDDDDRDADGDGDGDGDDDDSHDPPLRGLFPPFF